MLRRNPHHRHDFLGLLCAGVFLALSLTLVFQARLADARNGQTTCGVLDSQIVSPSVSSGLVTSAVFTP